MDKNPKEWGWNRLVCQETGSEMYFQIASLLKLT